MQFGAFLNHGSEKFIFIFAFVPAIFVWICWPATGLACNAMWVDNSRELNLRGRKRAILSCTFYFTLNSSAKCLFNT